MSLGVSGTETPGDAAHLKTSARVSVLHGLCAFEPLCFAALFTASVRGVGTRPVCGAKHAALGEWPREATRRSGTGSLSTAVVIGARHPGASFTPVTYTHRALQYCYGHKIRLDSIL